MAAITPDTGTGTNVSLSLAGNTSFIANITDWDWGGMSRQAFETSTLTTVGGKTFMPSDQYDPGQLQVTMHLDTDAAFTTVLTSTANTLTLTFPDGETASCSAFLTEYGFSADDGVMMATATLKFTGNITG